MLTKLQKIQKYRDFSDLHFKLYYKVKKLVKSIIRKNKPLSALKSDSENMEYSTYVEQLENRPKLLKKFRKPYKYRQILEHVNWETGLKYINRYLSLGGTRKELLDTAGTDRIGKPKRYFYASYGWLNPTQIRYLSVKQELSKLFELDKIVTIGEIGCGFGGQFLTISRRNSVDKYYFYDLRSVQKLIMYYLSHFQYSTKIFFPDISRLEEQKFDLVISNYAFSELPKNIQIEYVNKILRFATRGYMIMNSGWKNKTNRSEGKMTLHELTNVLPWIKIAEEVPLTGPDNYLIYWDRSREI